MQHKAPQGNNDGSDAVAAAQAEVQQLKDELQSLQVLPCAACTVFV